MNQWNPHPAEQEMQRANSTSTMNQWNPAEAEMQTRAIQPTSTMNQWDPHTMGQWNPHLAAAEMQRRSIPASTMDQWNLLDEALEMQRRAILTSTMNQWNPHLAAAEMLRRAQQGSTAMVPQPPPPASFFTYTTTFPPPPARKGRKIKASIGEGARGVHVTGGHFLNVANDLVINGANVDGVHFHDAVEGEEGDEIDVGYWKDASGTFDEGTQQLNVGGAVSYIPAGQHNGVSTKSSRVQKAGIHAHMFKGLRDSSKITGGQYTNVAGNVTYVGVHKSAPTSQGARNHGQRRRT